MAWRGPRSGVGQCREVPWVLSLLRSDLGAEISALRSDMNEGFAQVHAVLLDHTDRLARLEAIHAVHSHVPQ
ncbi:MAG: hypothetical protein OXF61_05325 [Acidimicrobiaceae bacterium]|nr:hypothetical protein [Acidimicrobiaceae bacterium]